MDLTAESNIEQVLTNFPGTETGTSTVRARRIDRSDDYAFLMGQRIIKNAGQKNNGLAFDRPRGDFAEEEAPGPTVNQVKQESTPDKIPDPFPSLALNKNYYAPAARVAGGLGYSIRFMFDKKLKTVLRDADPERPRRKIVVGYELNKEASLRSIMVQFNFSGTDRSAFWKELENKLEASGWIKSRRGTWSNTQSNNEIRMRGYNLQYIFREEE
jgi:hypothetical protein